MTTRPAELCNIPVGLLEPQGIAPEQPIPNIAIRTIPGLPLGFYNAAAVEHEGDVLLLGRQVQEAGVPGEPDIGTMCLAVLRGGVVQRLKQVWRPEPGKQGDLLEDARALVLPSGQLAVGYTRLALSEEKYQPFPAITVAPVEAFLDDLPPTSFIVGLGTGSETTPIGGGAGMFHLISGKNATPFVTPFGVGKLLFRPEGKDHQLMLFSVDATGAAQEPQYLDFPKKDVPYWA